jgi:hypothetical protein
LVWLSILYKRTRELFPNVICIFDPVWNIKCVFDCDKAVRHLYDFNFIHMFKLRHCLVICVDQISIKTIDVPLWSMLTTAMLNQLQTSLKWLSPILVEITPVVQRRRFLNYHTPERHMKTDAKWWVRWAKNVKFSTKYLRKLKEIL